MCLRVVCHAHKCMSGVDTQCLPWWLSTWFIEAFFSGYRTEIIVDLYSCIALVIAPFCLPSGGTKSGCHACIAFRVRTRDPNSTLHAYTLSTLLIHSHSAHPSSGLILHLSIPFAEVFLETPAHYSCSFLTCWFHACRQWILVIFTTILPANPSRIDPPSALFPTLITAWVHLVLLVCVWV